MKDPDQRLTPRTLGVSLWSGPFQYLSTLGRDPAEGPLQ
jgi:hypothetical protein